MSSDKKSSATLENLLRLKRLERPPAEFWAHFDKELRAKQLAAIVEQRPWWADFSRYYASLSRRHLPIGAAAAAALAIFGFHEYRSLTPVVSTASQTIAEAASPTSSVPEASPSLAGLDIPAPVRPAQASAFADTIATSKSSSAGFETERMPDSPLATVRSPSKVSARSDSSEIERNDRIDFPSARLVAENMAAVQAAEPGIIRNVLGMAQAFQAPIASNGQRRVEPLTMMTPPSEERRSQMLGDALPMMTGMESDVPARTSERLVSHLSDDRLYESISRLGVGGDRLSIKF